jgi:hypothetical protein
MEREVTKQEFKKLYFKSASRKSGWTKEYWDQFYEGEKNKQYFFCEPDTSDHTRMFIVSGNTKHRMIFLTEDAEETFFYFPEDQ